MSVKKILQKEAYWANSNHQLASLLALQSNVVTFYHHSEGDLPAFRCPTWFSLSYLVLVVLPDFVFLLLKATLNIGEYHPVDNLRLFYFIFYMSFLFHAITTPHYTIPPHHTTSFHTTPHHTTQHHTTPHNTTPHNTTPHHTTSHHTTPHHTTKVIEEVI